MRACVSKDLGEGSRKQCRNTDEDEDGRAGGLAR
jgi:hypothetical protein